MALIVASVDTDEADVSAFGPIEQRLFDNQIEYDRLEITSVTNPHRGDDEDASTYFVQTIAVTGDRGWTDFEHVVQTCTCKGFKYHKTPKMGSFDTGDKADLSSALWDCGECKHITEVRKTRRSEDTRPDDQNALDDFEGPQKSEPADFGDGESTGVNR